MYIEILEKIIILDSIMVFSILSIDLIIKPMIFKNIHIYII